MDAGAIEVDAAAQREAAARGEVPGNGVDAIGVGRSLGMVPEQAPCEVEHLDGELAGAARTVVVEDECGLRRGRTDGSRQAEDVDLLRAVDVEGEGGRGGIVLGVPGTEEQGMPALGECRDAERGRSSAVVAEFGSV